MTETCNAVGYLTVGGRKVGLLKCELEAGHELPPWPTPHKMTLQWDAEVPGIDWPEALDPEETFDVEVKLTPKYIGAKIPMLTDEQFADLPHSWARA